MRMFKKIFLAFFLFFALFFVPKTYAVEEFATSYDVVYDIASNGVTTVTEKVTLRNLTSQYYASEFKLTIGATDIFDIKGSDPGGVLEVSSKLQDTSTIITVKFNQQVAGLGKELPWTLQFKSKDFAEKVGKVWEVRAPRISSLSNLENYNLTLSVPNGFGEPTLISPTPKSQTSSSGKVFFTFNKDQLETSGVSASFGNFQLFDFDLEYHLENNNIVPILTNIALPPDTAFQDVIFQRITPQPINVTLDLDGNYLAWYKLTRGQRLDVKAIGSAKLYTTSKVKEPVLTEDLRKKYTEGAKYWEKDNPQIITALEGILGSNPQADSSKKVELIYRYVVNSLKYNPARLNEGNIERLGAATALSNPNSAVCMEFTDLFIALARAAGIAARELDGFAYTANPALRPLSLTGGADRAKDVLHAWPEYWNEKKGWIMVDPTWENTTGGVDYFNKLDLNHFVFAIKGSSSEQPVPAGSYKRSLRSDDLKRSLRSDDLKYIGEDTRDVKVSLTDVDFLGKPQVNVQIDAQDIFFAGFPAKIKVKITNLGNAVFPSAVFRVSSEKISILDSQSKNLGPIPAFGMATFEYNIRTKSLFDKFDSEIAVNIGSMKFEKRVSVEPFFLFQTIPLFTIGIVLVMIILYGAILGTLFYRRRFLKQPSKK